MNSQQKAVCIRIKDLHLMFFKHALLAILKSDDEGIAVLDSNRSWNKERTGKCHSNREEIEKRYLRIMLRYICS